MTAFTILGWLDAFDLAASLPKRMGEFKGEGRRTCPIFGFSPAGDALIDDLCAAGDRLGHEIDRASLEMLDAGHCSPWRKSETALRTHLVIRTNPRAVLYSGIEAISPGQGVLVAFDPRVPFSAVNLGQTPRIHLVVDWSPKRIEDRPPSHEPVASAAAP